MKKIKIKKVKVKKQTKEDVKDSLSTFAREFKFDYKPDVVDLVTNPEACRQATTGTCWRPDIYLNNDRSCDNCMLHTNCACSSKRLAKRTKIKG